MLHRKVLFFLRKRFIFPGPASASSCWGIGLHFGGGYGCRMANLMAVYFFLVSPRARRTGPTIPS